MANENRSLNRAQKEKKDEFYTRYEDVSRELVHYADQLRGKRIICPCDWDQSLDEVLVYASEEYVSGHDLFSPGGTIKIIDNAHINSHVVADISEVKCSFVKFLLAHAEDYGIDSIAVSGYNPSTGEGVRFQDLDYSNYDLVITNPPFSQLREFIDVMFENNLEFLVIGHQNAIKYSNVFPRIMNNEMWLGYGFPGNAAHFINLFYEDTATAADHKEGMIRVSGVVWLTNLDVDIRHDERILTEKYDPERYPKYINYNAIEVSESKDIPYDYTEEMGVPITFLTKFNPDQFEIVGISSSLAKPIAECAEEGASYEKGGPCFYTTKLRKKDFERGYTYHREYDRIVIKNKHPYIDED